MQVVFRADASSTIGSGHIMRCISLAKTLQARGASPRFVSRAYGGALSSVLEANGLPVSWLEAREEHRPHSAKSPYAGWLGASASVDAAETLRVIENLDAKPTWLVVDHYAIDQEWERLVRPAVGRIMVIDDLADRAHECDLILNQNRLAHVRTAYKALLPDGCGMLLGPTYALLQREYTRLSRRVPPRRGRVGRILIYFGGADVGDLTGRVLDAVLAVCSQDVVVDVVTSGSQSNGEAVAARAATAGNVRVHAALPSLAPLMAIADLAIGAAGATSWERCSVGLPALVISISENQRPIAAGLQQHGLVRWLGHFDQVSDSDIRAALREVLSAKLDEAWSQRCLAEVDAKGAQRVCTALFDAVDARLTTRFAINGDERLIAEGDSERRDWLRARMREIEGARLFVVEDDFAVELAIVAFVRGETSWRVEIVPTPVGSRHAALDGAAAAAFLQFRRGEHGLLTFLSSPAAGNPLHISICTGRDSWIEPTVAGLAVGWLQDGHSVSWSRSHKTLPRADVCFYLSYGRIVGLDALACHDANLVVHASALPHGRGWSPLTWQILEGRNNIPVTLFEAVQSLDSGPIYGQTEIRLRGNELIDELRALVASATADLCRQFVRQYPGVLGRGVPQEGTPTFYPRRNPEDSQLDIDRTLREQFNLLRTTDARNYPAWIEVAGKKFVLTIERMDADRRSAEGK